MCVFEPCEHVSDPDGSTAKSQKQISASVLLLECVDALCLLQKRKAEAVPLATQVSPATPVPSLPSSAEASQAAVFPAVRETSTFKSREDHEPLASLTTTVRRSLLRLSLCLQAVGCRLKCRSLSSAAAKRDGSTDRPPAADRQEEEGQLWPGRRGTKPESSV